MKYIFALTFFAILTISSVAQNNNNYPFYKNGLYGFKNKAGKVVLKEAYSNVQPSKGAAFIIQKDLDKGLKWGAVNKKNKTIIPFIYEDLSYISETVIAGFVPNQIHLFNTKGELLAKYADDKWELIKLDTNASALVANKYKTYYNRRDRYYLYPFNETYDDYELKEIYSDEFPRELIRKVLILTNYQEKGFRILDEQYNSLFDLKIPLHLRCMDWNLPLDQLVFYSRGEILNPSFPNKLADKEILSVRKSNNSNRLIEIQTKEGIEYYDNYLNKVYNSINEDIELYKNDFGLFKATEDSVLYISLKTGKVSSLDSLQIDNVEMLKNAILVFHYKSEFEASMHILREQNEELLVEPIEAFEAYMPPAGLYVKKDSLFWIDSQYNFEYFHPKNWLKSSSLSKRELLLLDEWNHKDSASISIIGEQGKYILFSVPKEGIGYVFTTDQTFVSTVDLSSMQDNAFVDYSNDNMYLLWYDLRKFSVPKDFNLVPFLAELQQSDRDFIEYQNNIYYQYTSDGKNGLKDVFTDKVIIKAAYDKITVCEDFDEFIGFGQKGEQWELIGLPPYDNMLLSEKAYSHLRAYSKECFRFPTHKVYRAYNFYLIVEKGKVTMLNLEPTNRVSVKDGFPFQVYNMVNEDGTSETVVLSADFRVLHKQVDACIIHEFPYQGIMVERNNQMFYISE